MPETSKPVPQAAIGRAEASSDKGGMLLFATEPRYLEVSVEELVLYKFLVSKAKAVRF